MALALMSSACTYKHNILDLKKEFMSDVLRLESPRLLKTHVLGRQALGYHKGGNRGVVCTLLTASGFTFERDPDISIFEK